MPELDKDLQILAFAYTPEEQDHLEALLSERGGRMTLAEAIALMELYRGTHTPRQTDERVNAPRG
jgi:hypothetical protein